MRTKIPLQGTSAGCSNIGASFRLCLTPLCLPERLRPRQAKAEGVHGESAERRAGEFGGTPQKNQGTPRPHRRQPPPSLLPQVVNDAEMAQLTTFYEHNFKEGDPERKVFTDWKDRVMRKNTDEVLEFKKLPVAFEELIKGLENKKVG